MDSHMKIYVGVDVGKFNLDVYYLNKHFQITNDSTGIASLLEDFKNNITTSDNIVVICEATGGYEQLLIKTLLKHAISFHIAHPNKVRAFAKTQGILAKTDRIDAIILRDYGELIHPQPSKNLLSESANTIRSLIKRRDQLLDDQRREQARLDKLTLPDVKNSVQSHITWIAQEINNINAKIEKASMEDTIKQQVELLTSVPSVGNFTALMLISYLPELGNANGAQISALVGVAPFNKDSGRYKGKRFIQGGRSMIRKSLYMSAVSSIRWNPDMKSFYTRLRKSGKPAKVALVAVMRKLLILLNNIIKRQTPWEINNPKKLFMA